MRWENWWTDLILFWICSTLNDFCCYPLLYRICNYSIFSSNKFLGYIFLSFWRVRISIETRYFLNWECVRVALFNSNITLYLFFSSYFHFAKWNSLHILLIWNITQETTLPKSIFHILEFFLMVSWETSELSLLYIYAHRKVFFSLHGNAIHSLSNIVPSYNVQAIQTSSKIFSAFTTFKKVWAADHEMTKNREAGMNWLKFLRWIRILYSYYIKSNFYRRKIRITSRNWAISVKFS